MEKVSWFQTFVCCFNITLFFPASLVAWTPSVILFGKKQLTSQPSCLSQDQLFSIAYISADAQRESRAHVSGKLLLQKTPNRLFCFLSSFPILILIPYTNIPYLNLNRFWKDPEQLLYKTYKKNLLLATCAREPVSCWRLAADIGS